MGCQFLLQDNTVNSLFTFLGIPELFSTLAALFQSHQECTRVLISLHHLQHLLFLLQNMNHSKVCEAVSCCSSDLYFYNDYVTILHVLNGHLCICFGETCIQVHYVFFVFP